MPRLLPPKEVVPAYLLAAGAAYLVYDQVCIDDDVAVALGAAMAGGGATLFGLVLTAQGIILSAAVSSDRVQNIIAVRRDVATAVARLAVRCEAWLGLLTAAGIVLLVSRDVLAAAVGAGVTTMVTVRLARLSSQTRALLLLAMEPPAHADARVDRGIIDDDELDALD